MRIWDSEEGTLFTPWLLSTDELIVQILKAHRHNCHGKTTVTLICNVSPGGLQTLQPCRLMKPFEIPKNSLQNLNFSGNHKELYCFLLSSQKLDILEVQSLLPRVVTGSHRSPSTDRNKLINHWYSYLPETSNVLNSKRLTMWSESQNCAVCDPAVPCPPPVVQQVQRCRQRPQLSNCKKRSGRRWLICVSDI